MPIEIERKFLVIGSDWRQPCPHHLTQGYLSRDAHCTVRVRIDDDRGFLTVKGITTGATRSEFEYPIPLPDAEQLLALCKGPIIEKLRHEVMFDGIRWDIDEFLGDNAGLVIAEIELEREAQAFAKPAWLGEEVTDDPRYFNSNLTIHPYATWPAQTTR
jgi:CYTH domain-containing protein